MTTISVTYFIVSIIHVFSSCIRVKYTYLVNITFQFSESKTICVPTIFLNGFALNIIIMVVKSSMNLCV